MEECGLLSIDDLKRIEERDTNRELNSLRKELRSGLIRVAKWLRETNVVNVLQGFNEDVYDDLCKEEERVQFAKYYITNALGTLGRDENISSFKDVEEDEELLKEVIRQSKREIMESSNLRAKCATFDHDAFLDESIRHFHKLVGQSEQSQKRVVIHGDTQSGKTAAGIGIPLSMCGLLKLPMVVLTKGVDESIDLTEKLKDLTLGTATKEEHVIVGEFV